MTLVLRGARLVDGTGADPRPDTTVVVEGERIFRVGGSSAERAEDLSGLTLLPGLIDAHTHLGLVDLSAEGIRAPAAVIAAKIFRICDTTLDHGFTTVRDVGGVDGGLARAVELGLVRGPRIFPSGPIICQTGGHGDMRSPFDHHHAPKHPGLAHLAEIVDGPEGVRLAAREAFRHGATQIKVCVSGGVVSLSDDLEDTQLTVPELRSAVEEAAARQTYVTAHAHNVRGMRNGLTAGVKCFEHATFLDQETAQLIARAGAVIVPTLAVCHLMHSEWEEWGIPEESLERVQGVEDSMGHAIKLALDAGIKVGSGSDLLGPKQDRRGLEILLKARIMGPMGALVSATRTNAEIMGIADETGTVTEGKVADLVAFDGDPIADPEMFDDPSRVVLVVQRGRIVKDTRT